MLKYKKWYDNIINNAKSRILSGYVEVHHIIPRSLGGTDDKSNLVQLTAREHFICHILLTKFLTGQDKYKMLHACIIMKAKSKGQSRYINSRLYESIRKQYSIAKTGVHNNSWNTGLTVDSSEKLKEIGNKISKALKGRPSKKKGKPGMKASEETKLKMSEARKGKMLWWNNGKDSIRGNECPGKEWIRGRLKTNMSPIFLKQNITYS
jgi:hypothetical protein